MREILFRGKRVDNGEWVQGYYVYDDSGQLTEKPIAYIVRLHEHPCGFSMLPFEVIPESVSEFTGLTDKNGTKIFEGDIVKATPYGETEIAFIKYYKNAFYTFDLDREFLTCPEGEPLMFADEQIEVIGNIHDNPERALRGEGEIT